MYYSSGVNKKGKALKYEQTVCPIFETLYRDDLMMP